MRIHGGALRTTALLLLLPGCGGVKKTLAHAGLDSCKGQLQPEPGPLAESFANLAGGRVTLNQVVVITEGPESCTFLAPAREAVSGVLGCIRSEIDADPVGEPDDVVAALEIAAHSPSEEGFIGLTVTGDLQPAGSGSKTLHSCLAEVGSTLATTLQRANEGHAWKSEALDRLTIRVQTVPSAQILAARKAEEDRKAAAARDAAAGKARLADADKARAQSAADTARSALLEACKAGVIQPSDWVASASPAAGQGYCLQMGAITLQMTGEKSGLFKVPDTAKVFWVDFPAAFKGPGFTGVVRVEAPRRNAAGSGMPAEMATLRVLRLDRVGLP